MKTKNEFQKFIGSNVRKIRTSKNWSIERLALESGLTYSQIGRLELGKRNCSIYTLYIISYTLETEPSDLFKI
jgi:transcriptional regulator with XRE-family HTH domain